jgi:hypothetical protein
MGLHTETEIHRTAYDLLQVVVAASRNMPRDVRPSTGRKIQDELLEVFEDIYQANVARDADKVPHLDGVRRRIQRVEILLRVSRDMRFITTPAYADAISLTQSIGRQATAWRKFSAAQAPAA